MPLEMISWPIAMEMREHVYSQVSHCWINIPVTQGHFSENLKEQQFEPENTDVFKNS